MVVRVSTLAFEGIDTRPVDVQVQLSGGDVKFMIVGLADKAVAESRERVRSALNASGLALPAKRITINLAPADLPKEGSHYDLPIALGVMAAIGAIPADALSGYTIIGELALDGTISPVAGVLPAAIAANGRGNGLILPSPAEGSAEAGQRVTAVRILQRERYDALGLAHVGTNAAAPANVIEDAVRLDSRARKLVHEAAERMHLSARGFHRVLKLARTLADLDGSGDTGRIHLAEALSYRGQADAGARAA